jgi:predicted DNA binding CopG/RHH family protein
MKLNKKEKELLKSFESDEWNSVKDLEKKKNELIKTAKNTTAKNKRINIHLSEKDLANLKEKSIEEGLSFQALIASIIHKYVSGKFKEV